jgi:hypothetical protein
VLALLNAALTGTMTAATVQTAVALVEGELAGELVWFDALGLLAPQAASANVVRAKAVRTRTRKVKVGLMGRSPYTEAMLGGLPPRPLCAQTVAAATDSNFRIDKPWLSISLATSSMIALPSPCSAVTIAIRCKPAFTA